MVSNGQTLTMNIDEAAKQLGISRGLAYELAGKGELPGVIRLGHRFVVSKFALENTLKGGNQKPAES
jgi:excisionase family DNA binding protein